MLKIPLEVVFIPGHKQLSVRLLDADLERLHKLAKQNNVSVAEQARQYILKGMSVNAYQNDEEIILSNMRASLKQILDPQIERMVKINVKNSVSTSINLLYTAFLMQRMARGESRPKLEAVMDEARRLGILFVQQAKGSIDDFIKTSIDRINAMWEDT